MGRKKIQISRIVDERNRQASWLRENTPLFTSWRGKIPLYPVIWQEKRRQRFFISHLSFFLPHSSPPNKIIPEFCENLARRLIENNWATNFQTRVRVRIRFGISSPLSLRHLQRPSRTTPALPYCKYFFNEKRFIFSSLNVHQFCLSVSAVWQRQPKEVRIRARNH